MKLIEVTKNNKQKLGVYGGLIACLIIFTILPPLRGENLWTATKMATLMSDVIVLAILSVGAVFIYSLGNIDISIGKQVGLYATIIVVLGNNTGSLLPGVALCLLIALAIGAINGAAGDLLNIHPIISSLVFMMILGGVNSITYNIIGSRSISLRNVDYSMFKNTWLMFAVLLVVFLIISYFFHFTKFGKYAKAIGANSKVAEQCGIHVIKYKIISYMFMSVTIVIASLFQMGYTGSASDSTGTGYEMNVMVALILGGMPLSGGMKSKVLFALVGSLTYSLLNIGLPLLGAKPNQVFIIKSLIFLIVVLLTSRKKYGVLPR